MIEPNLESSVAAILRPHMDKADDDPDWSVRRRRRKFRGQAHYYREVQRRAQSFSPELGVEDWYDLWHYHVDRTGHGNLGWKHRLRHLEALCVVFSTFARSTASYHQPYQLFLFLDCNDAKYDAIYFHTPNPNKGSCFPSISNKIMWGVPTLEQYLSQMLGLPMRVGLQVLGKNHRIFYAYSPAVGRSLEAG